VLPNEVEAEAGSQGPTPALTQVNAVDEAEAPEEEGALLLLTGLGGVPEVVPCCVIVVVRLGLQARAAGLRLEPGAGHKPQGAAEPEADGNRQTIGDSIGGDGRWGGAKDSQRHSTPP